MKTTFVITSKELNTFKLALSKELEYVDYFLDRKKLIRWYKSAPDTIHDGRFYMLDGMIDISYYTTSLMDSEEAKQLATYKNVEYLVKKNKLGEIFFNNISEPGIIFRVIAEDIKTESIIFNEFHIVFDCQLKELPDITYVDLFYGNVYDYIENKKAKEKL